MPLAMNVGRQSVSKAIWFGSSNMETLNTERHKSVMRHTQQVENWNMHAVIKIINFQQLYGTFHTCHARKFIESTEASSCRAHKHTQLYTPGCQLNGFRHQSSLIVVTNQVAHGVDIAPFRRLPQAHERRACVSFASLPCGSNVAQDIVYINYYTYALYMVCAVNYTITADSSWKRE